MTFKLLLTHDGRKMGKTESRRTVARSRQDHALRLLPVLAETWTTQDVEKCLALLTFLPMDEVRRLGALQGC